MKITDKHLKNGLIISAFTVALIFLFLNLPSLIKGISFILKVLIPLFIGIVIAFLLNLIMIRYEKLFFKNKNIDSKKRVLSLSATYLTVVIILFLISLLIMPQIFESVKSLISNLGHYTDKITEFCDSLIKKYNSLNFITIDFLSVWNNFVDSAKTWAIDSVPAVLDSTISFFGSIVNFVLGVVFSIYILFSKEKFIKSIKNITNYLLPKRKAKNLEEVVKVTNKTFTNFVSGQIIEAIILGTLCTIGLIILKMPYAVLIGTFIGLTSLIPIFGAYIGAIPSAFLILMEDPVKAIIFLIFLVLLQQFEGNVIYPKVVGKSVGLSGFWIMLAVLVGASLGGILGVLVGVPLTSVVYYFITTKINKKLEEKEA